MTKCCPLCKSLSISQYHQDQKRCYLNCAECGLVFVPEKYWLSRAEEKAQYDLHENNPYDPGYRKFLGRLYNPLNQLLAPGSKGLDFGSGPGPTLSVMFEEMGHSVSLYDRIYANNAAVFHSEYDFITATEVFEHLQQPDLEFSRLWSVLKPGGFLGIMTKLVLNQPAFAAWHYKNDPTHIIFFSKQTLGWLAKKYSARTEYHDHDVIILRKKVK